MEGKLFRRYKKIEINSMGFAVAATASPTDDEQLIFRCY